LRRRLIDDVWTGMDAVLIAGYDRGALWRAKIRRMNTCRQRKERDLQDDELPETSTLMAALPAWVRAALERAPLPTAAPAKKPRTRKPQPRPLSDRVAALLAEHEHDEEWTQERIAQEAGASTALVKKVKRELAERSA
jgi:hypothetical protein